MTGLSYRRVARETSIRYRYKSLTAHETIRLGYLSRIGALIARRMMNATDQSEKERHRRKLTIILLMKKSILEDTYDPIPPPIRHIVSIETTSPDFSKEFLRFRQEHLRQLFIALRFPNLVVFRNRSTMTGEEVFLRGLYELANGVKKTNVAETYGRHVSDQSRAFVWFINHLYDGFHHLMENNLNWWYQSGFLDKSAELIVRKMGVSPPFKYCGFIDCNCLETLRPGGGPRESGEDADRWDEEVQRSFYNGWKSIHGLKHQTVDNALGFTMDIYGPTSLRRNDLTLFRESNINTRMRNLGNGEYVLFGDSAYRAQSNTKSYGEDEAINRKMKSVRISIEWNYMITAQLFHFIAIKRKLKVFETAAISRIFIVATFLKNVYGILYGNQTMIYFEYVLPENFLHLYLNQQVEQV